MTGTLPPVRSTNFFPASGGSWCYDLWGFHGRPLVLIPTLLFGRVSWWPAAADLRPHATVIAVDLPGHGDSPPRVHYEPEELVDDLAQLVAGLGIRRAPIVVGHGTSAILATLLAARYATHAVVAVDPCRPPDRTTNIEAYLHAMSHEAVPEHYRCLVQTTRDPHLYAAYAAGLRRLRPAAATMGATPQRLAQHSHSPGSPGAGAAKQWRHVSYDVSGRFAQLTAIHRFVTDIRRLL